MTELHCSYCDRILENPKKIQITAHEQGRNVYCKGGSCRNSYYYELTSPHKKETKNCLVCNNPFYDLPKVLCCSNECKRERQKHLKREREEQKTNGTYVSPAIAKAKARELAEKKRRLEKAKKEEKIIAQNRKYLIRSISDKTSPLRHENQWVKVSNKDYDEAFLDMQKVDPDEYIKRNWVV